MRTVKCLLGFHKYGTYHSIRQDPELQTDPEKIVYTSDRNCQRCKKMGIFRRTINKHNNLISTKWTRV